MGEKRYMQGFGGKPEERPRHRRDGNIKINLRKMGWGMDWIDMAQDRDRCRALVNAVMNLWVPFNARSLLGNRGSVSFSGRTLLHGVK